MRRSLLHAMLIGTGSLLLGFAVLALIVPLPDRKPYSRTVTDRSGQLLHAFLASDDRWRLETKPEEIPQKLKTLLLHKEDRYFSYHPGVNPFSVVRAFFRNLESGDRRSGASTITMQVARMLEPRERTYWAKLVEAFRALQLELKYSKDEILEMYLSMVPLGGNIEGLNSAALLYYQTPLERINIAHLIDLIIIPNDPNRLRPDRGGERLYEERIRNAERWITEGLLTEEDSLIVWNTPSRVVRVQPPQRAPHFSVRITQAGLHDSPAIRTTIDADIQRTAERLLASHMRVWRQKGVAHGAVLIADNRTRDILAYVGSPDFEDSTIHGQVDGVRAIRSPGSALKPFLVALQIDKGMLTPKRVLLDTPYDAEGFYAENYDGTFSGTAYVDQALRRSLNVPMIRTLQETGVSEFANHLVKAGFTSLESQKDGLGLSMVVGGCGVTLEELTAAYLVFPNGGSYGPLRAVVGHGEGSLREVYSQATSYMITEILAGLDRPDLPNNFESSVNLPKVAFKTGTSYGRRDAWSIGYSAHLTIGVWVGNADNRGSSELVGSKAAAPLLIDLFNAVSPRYLKSILPMPSDVGIREVCARSGKLPTPRCTQKILDYYSYTKTLNVSCDLEREFQIAIDGRFHYCASCLGSHPHKAAVYADHPAELVSFWDKTGYQYRKVPPHNPECTRVFAGEGPRILSPTNGMTYYQVSARQQLTLVATSTVDVQEHRWYYDRAFLGRNKAGDKLFLPMSAGEHIITCTDEKGRASTITILIKDAS